MIKRKRIEKTCQQCGIVFMARLDNPGKFCSISCQNKCNKTIHGLTDHSLSRVLNGMWNRCTNKNHPQYSNYGGRGISVCEEWHDRKVFYDWAMSHGYKKGLQIDRRNNNGNYSPDNCRFVTNLVNMHNRRLRTDWGLSKRGNSYQVVITYNYKVHRPGSSTDYNEAILLRDNLLKTLSCAP